MQKIVFIRDNHVTIQNETQSYSDTLENFLADGGYLPTKAILHVTTETGQVEQQEIFKSLDCNLDTGDCWINGLPFQSAPEHYVQSILAKVDELMAAKTIREQQTIDERTQADFDKWNKEAQAAEQARLATQTIEEAKAEKLAEINAACDAILKETIASYPDTEVQTFDQQVTEATACQATGNPADAPLLAALADARGISLNDLCNRVLAKRARFSVLSGCIIGQRQALEDRLDGLDTIEAVRALTVDIRLPSETN